MARPTEYSQEIIDKANSYIDSCIDEEVQRIKTEGEKSTTYELGINVKIPTIEGLAVAIGVARSTVYEWQKAHEEFSDIIEKLQSIQAERLLNNGLSGTYNSTIAKVLLTKHGYIERQDTDITSKNKQIGLLNLINVRNNNSNSEDTEPQQEN